MLASLLIQGILSEWPRAQIYGIGGPSMCALGFKALWPSHKLSVRGYFEVLLHLREILRIRRALRDELLRNPPDLFIGVDAPDFNLGLERDLKQAGIPCLHFICPSVWAWRAKRINTLAHSVDHVLCVFPFEPAILEAKHIAATFVGYPLAQHIPSTPSQLSARAALGVSPQARVVTLMPGSRASEVQQMTKRFLLAARIMQESDPSIEFLLPVVPHLSEWVRAQCKRYPVAHLNIIEANSHQALAASDAVLVASGTATLEAALFKCPMVIGYHVNWLSYYLIWPRRLLPWIGLPNILLGREVVPELLQSKATPDAMARAVLHWLHSPLEVARLREVFSQLHEQLRGDTPAIATQVIKELLDKRAAAQRSP